jgi:acyl carrier protein
VQVETMTRAELLTKIRDILADVLDNERLVLTEASTADEVEDWDSINQVKLLIGLEEELGFRFDTPEVEGLANVGSLIDVLERKVKA